MIRWWRRRQQIRRDRRQLMVLCTCTALGGRAAAVELHWVTGLPPGLIRVALIQLERDGAVNNEWVGLDTHRRCYYRITEYGDRQTRHLATQLSRAWATYQAAP